MRIASPSRPYLGRNVGDRCEVVVAIVHLEQTIIGLVIARHGVGRLTATGQGARDNSSADRQRRRDLLGLESTDIIELGIGSPQQEAGGVGVGLDQETGQAEAYELAYEALAVATRENIKKLNDDQTTGPSMPAPVLPPVAAPPPAALPP